MNRFLGGLARWTADKATAYLEQAPSLKAASQVFFPRTMGSMFVGVPNTQHNYAQEVGSGGNSSVVMAVINWIMRAFPEAPIVVQERRRGKDWETVVDHELSRLLASPNDFYSGEHLWMASMWAWCLFGNAFWRLERQRDNKVKQIWWVEPWLIEPAWDQGRSGASTKFVTHYVYRPGGRSIDLPLDQVVHFRHGIDPENKRLGMPPLQSVLREIWSDDESSNWVASLLRNMGVPGMIVSPTGDFGISEDEAEALKTYVKGRFTGDHRGEPMTLGSPIKVDKLSFSPSELDLSVVRNTAEERVCSCLGIPAAVVGFGTGLESTKVGATMSEMRRLAWQNGIVPVQRIMAGEVGRAMLPAYDPRAERLQVAWDYAHVHALQEDENTKATRYSLMVSGGFVLVSEARRAMGLDTTPEDEIYLRPSSLTPTDPNDQLPEPMPVPLPLALPNGNGNTNGNRQTALNGNGKDIKNQSVEHFFHSIISRHAPRIETPPVQLTRLATRLAIAQQSVQSRAEQMIIDGFQQIGTKIVAVAKYTLNIKQDLSDYVTVSRILDQIPMATLTGDLSRVYEALYVLIAEKTVEALSAALDVEPADVLQPVNEALFATAPRRAGLIDLPIQLRESIFSVLEEARSGGMSEQEMMKLLEERIPAGPWRDVKTRARITARSELRYAQNVASTTFAHSQGITHMLVFDARLGATDEICELRNGMIVTVDEARVIADLEHPNGTFSVAPISQVVLQELKVAV